MVLELVGVLLFELPSVVSSVHELLLLKDFLWMCAAQDLLFVGANDLFDLPFEVLFAVGRRCG